MKSEDSTPSEVRVGKKSTKPDPIWKRVPRNAAAFKELYCGGTTFSEFKKNKEAHIESGLKCIDVDMKNKIITYEREDKA